MNRIEEYIENIYKNFDKNDEETKILKEEMKAHLFEELEEMKKDGLTEDESINIIISKFGGEKAVISKLSLILKKRDTFLKILKISAITILIFASIFKIVQLGDILIHLNENPLAYDNNNSFSITDNIPNKSINKDSLDIPLKNQITQLLDEFNRRNNNGIYSLRILNKENLKVEYEYNKDVTNDMVKSGFKRLLHSSKWDFYFKITDKQNIYDTKKTDEAWNKMVSRIPYRLGEVANYLFLILLILLCGYLVKKVYNKISSINRTENEWNYKSIF